MITLSLQCVIPRRSIPTRLPSSHLPCGGERSDRETSVPCVSQSVTSSQRRIRSRCLKDRELKCSAFCAQRKTGERPRRVFRQRSFRTNHHRYDFPALHFPALQKLPSREVLILSHPKNFCVTSRCSCTLCLRLLAKRSLLFPRPPSPLQAPSAFFMYCVPSGECWLASACAIHVIPLGVQTCANYIMM